MSVLASLLILYSISSLIHKVDAECSNIRQLLDDDTITVGGPHNDICILDSPSCCNKAVENQLLDKTIAVLKNRLFLLLNKFYQKIDIDNNDKQSDITEFIKKTTLSQDEKINLAEKFSLYKTGVNSLTTEDLDNIKTASAVGSLSSSLKVPISDVCQNLLYFEMEKLKDAEIKYLSSLLLMLRGYNILITIIENVQKPDLTADCYIGAVRGGLKFAGCELCDDTTAFAAPCVKLCRNILSGCLKSHIDARDYIQLLAQYQIKLNELVTSKRRDRETALDNLKLEVNNKLTFDNEFYTSCSSLQSTSSGNAEEYTTALDYDETDARNTLESSWLCTFVFNGISEVNCWNRSAVGEYRLNVYEFTEEGQFQNPEVPGSGPAVDIEICIEQFEDYKLKVDEFEQGRDVLKAKAAAIAPPLTVISLLVIFYTTLS